MDVALCVLLYNTETFYINSSSGENLLILLREYLSTFHTKQSNNNDNVFAVRGFSQHRVHFAKVLLLLRVPTSRGPRALIS